MTISRAEPAVAASGLLPTSGWSLPAGVRPALRGLAGVAVVVLLLDVAIALDAIDNSVVPRVSVIATTFVGLLGEGAFWTDVRATLGSWAAALAIAGVVGTVVGIGVGRSPFLYAGVRPIVDGFRSTSAVALIPIAVLFFGVGSTMKIALAVYAAVWPMILGGIHGSAGIERTLIDVTRLLHWSAWRRARLLVLPSTAPFLASALRTSSLVVLVVVVSAEIITGSDGLGRFVAATQRTGVGLDRMYAAIVATGIVGLLLDGLISRLQGVLIRWQPKAEDI